MGKYQKAHMTRKGMELLTQSQLGEGGIIFTRGVSGSGIWDADEDITEMTELVDERQSFPLNSVTQNSSVSVGVKFVITNKTADEELEEGYYVSEIGIYAKIGDSDEVLYAVAQADVPDYLPTYDDLMPASIAVDLYCEVGNADNVVIEAAEGVYALSEDLELYVPKIDITQSGAGAAEDKIPSLKAVSDYFVRKSSVSQTTGTSTTHIMSQKAVSDYFVQKSSVSQTTGTSTTHIMSQKAVTDEFALYLKKSELLDASFGSATLTTGNNTLSLPQSAGYWHNFPFAKIEKSVPIGEAEWTWTLSGGMHLPRKGWYIVDFTLTAANSIPGTYQMALAMSKNGFTSGENVYEKLFYLDSGKQYFTETMLYEAVDDSTYLKLLYKAPVATAWQINSGSRLKFKYLGK